MFFNFFCLSFSYLFGQWLTFYWACWNSLKLLRKHHWDWQFLPWSTCSWVLLLKILLHNIHSNFSAFLCISFKLHWTNHSALGSTGKILLQNLHCKYRWCQFWSTEFVPFFRNKFPDFSRTQIDFTKALKFTLTPTLPRSQC